MKYVKYVAAVAVLYVIIAMIGCKMMAAMFYPVLAAIHGDDNVKITALEIGSEEYYHACLMVRGKPWEPRFLGLMLLPHIDYDNPLYVWDNVEAFRVDESILPFA